MISVDLLHKVNDLLFCLVIGEPLVQVGDHVDTDGAGQAVRGLCLERGSDKLFMLMSECWLLLSTLLTFITNKNK